MSCNFTRAYLSSTRSPLTGSLSHYSVASFLFAFAPLAPWSVFVPGATAKKGTGSRFSADSRQFFEPEVGITTANAYGWGCFRALTTEYSGVAQPPLPY